MKATQALLAPFIAGASATIYYAGVAESGGEFGAYGTPGTGLPGVFGKDYQFINQAGIDTHVDENHLNLFRIAFLLERMCPLATGLGATFDETHFGHYKEAVDYVTVTKGAYAILDPHNYMRYNDPSSQPYSGSVIGNTSDATAATTEQFGAFWGELAGRFKDNEKVIFGLMNEPHDMSSELVLANNQAAIDAIRAAGATNLIIMPGNSWTGGHAWTEGSDPSSAVMNMFKDPANNTAIDIHEYLDVDYSGTHAACVNDAATHLADLTAWLKTNNLKAFITEFGGANNTGCATMLEDMINYMATNEEYIGWTAWAAGPFWGPNSPCCTDSLQYGSLEPGSTAGDGSPGLYETLWLPVYQPLIPEELQWSGKASVEGGELSTFQARG
ncbi:glycoside hydrolase family 5 protein [Nemania abortiva]|nr:glycoside hydrolase family 5 protein [Nemania abortiva]